MEVDVGDRIEVESEPVGQPCRSGVVTAVSGPLLTVRWDDGHESTFAPAAGAMTVTGRDKDRIGNHPG